MDLSGFNPNEHEPGGNNFEPMPKGWYQAMITESEEKDTRAGDGTYLSLTFEVDQEPFKGRKVWANLNLNNPNPKAVEIATRNLADICRATGVMAPKNSEELHYKPIAIYVVQKEWNGETKNEIKGFRPLKGEASSSSRTAPASSKQGAPAAPKTPPWQRKAS